MLAARWTSASSRPVELTNTVARTRSTCASSIRLHRYTYRKALLLQARQVGSSFAERRFPSNRLFSCSAGRASSAIDLGPTFSNLNAPLPTDSVAEVVVVAAEASSRIPTQTLMDITSTVVPSSISATSPSWLLVDQPSPSILATQLQDHVVANDLAWYNVSSYVMDLVHFTHDITGLSYAVSVASITLGIRLFLILPFGIVSLRADPNIDQDIESLEKQIKATKDTTRHNLLVSKYKKMLDRKKKDTIRSFAMPIMSFGTFMVMWFGLRYMGVYYPEDLASGGTLWFPDLTQRDPFMFLPILSSVTFVLMGEVGADQLGRPSREFSPLWANAWRLFRLSTVYIFIDAPAAIFCYWIPNSSASVLQSVILSQPSVRAAIGVIPERPKSTKETPVIQYVSGETAKKQELSGEITGTTTTSNKGKKAGSRQLSINKKRKTKRKR